MEEKKSKVTLGDLVQIAFVFTGIIAVVFYRESPEFRQISIEIIKWGLIGIVGLILFIIAAIFLLWLLGKTIGQIILGSLLVFAVATEAGGWSAFAVAVLIIFALLNAKIVSDHQKDINKLHENISNLKKGLFT